MTVGNDLVDNRVTVGHSTGNSLNVGSYWKKTWNGGDNTTRMGYIPPSYTRNEKGKLVRRHWTRPPKRGRSQGEHTYTMSLYSSYNPDCGYTTKGSSVVHYTDWRSFAGDPSFVSKWSSNDDLALLGKLREKVSGSTFNAAVSMAEANQSLQMILSAAKALDGAWSHAKRGNFAAAAKSIADYERGAGRVRQARRTISSAWLQNQYGIKPLLNDVFEAAQTLAHLTSVPLQQTYTVTRKVKGVVTPCFLPAKYANLAVKEGYEAVKIKAIVREVNVVQLLGLADPASVAWEKLPYSFVADWFVPIGSYLAARGLAQAVTGTFVTSRTVKWAASGGIVPGVETSGYSSFTGMEAFRWRVVTLSRGISVNLFVPRPSVKPLGKMTTWSHAASATALLSQKHGSMTRK